MSNSIWIIKMYVEAFLVSMDSSRSLIYGQIKIELVVSPALFINATIQSASVWSEKFIQRHTPNARRID